MNNKKGNHRSLLNSLSYQEATALGTNGRTKTNTITIDQGLIESSVSTHHSIELLLNLDD